MTAPCFGVLGPVEVTIAGRLVDLGGQRPLTLLALLLATGGREVPPHRLVEVLWGTEAPPNAIGTVHSYLARLRRALEPDRPPRRPSTVLVRVGAGYAVRPAPGALDADRFSVAAARGQELLEQRRYAAARTALESALREWRGTPYADFPEAPFALPVARRLEEQRLAARIGLLAAEIGLGRHAAAVPELTSLSREHPGRERIWELLALALYRSGRQVDALDALREARTLLRAEFGVDPGPTLLRVEKALRNNEDPAPPATPPRQAPPPAAERVAGGPAPSDALPATDALVTSAMGVVLAATAMGAGTATSPPGTAATWAHAAATGVATTPAPTATTPGQTAAAAPARTATTPGQTATAAPAPARTTPPTETAATTPAPTATTPAQTAATTPAATAATSAPAGTTPPTQTAATTPAPTAATSAAARITAAGVPRTAVPPAAPAASAPTAVVTAPPVPLTRLEGREAELAAVAGWFGRCRLVTLVGAPGVGKSRVAIEHGRRAAGRVHYVRAAAGAPLAAAGPGLTIVDDADLRREAVAAEVRAALEADPGLRVLVTCRQPLGLPGEAVVEVSPLPPDAAAALFTARAAEAGCREHDPGLVDHICALVDRIPLAIEAQAARARALSLAAIAVSLAGKPPARPPEPVVAAAVDRSRRLLDRDGAALLGRLAVFEGAFDLDAVAAVAPDDGSPERIADLVDRSLLRVEPGGGETRRYRLPAPVREYARTLLPAAEERRTALRHREWMRAFATRADMGMWDAALDDWLRRLTAEKDNLYAALRGCLADGDAATAVEIAGGVSFFWFHTGAVEEGASWLRAALDGKGQDMSLDGTVARARANLGLSAILSLTGNVSEGLRRAHAALAQAERCGHDYLRVDALCGMSFLAAGAGEQALAARTAAEAARGAERGGWLDLRANAMTMRGNARYLAGDLASAAGLFGEAVTMARSSASRWVSTMAGWLDVEVAIDRSRYDHALPAALVLNKGLTGAALTTSWLVTGLSLARSLTLSGRAEEGALLQGAVTGIGRAVGVAAAGIGRTRPARERDDVPSGRHAAAYVRGLRMSVAEASALVTVLAEAA